MELMALREDSYAELGRWLRHEMTMHRKAGRCFAQIRLLPRLFQELIMAG